MSKLTLLTVALLLSFALTYAARPQQVLSDDSLDAMAEEAAVVESCEGLGEEECLMRRTLAAHVDYIYTQKHKP
ncbi:PHYTOSULFOKINE PROTEIN [Salix purpurea]|uniref:Phytosulfokine n=1 Tax=Salix purpurea TaxID=77065 RepID=A0A9Q0SQK9_SALPP|nr:PHYTOSULFOKINE PROTEIN [Salix purpurea]